VVSRIEDTKNAVTEAITMPIMATDTSTSMRVKPSSEERART
jgi:hypothetical protein